VVVTAGLWKITPGSLVPDEDQGYYIGAVFLPDGATLQRTDRVVSEVLKAVQSNPANEYAVAFTGLDFIGGGFRNSAATIFVTQKHWDERSGVGTQQLIRDYFMKTAHIKEGLVLAFAPPPIFGLGNAGGFEFYIQNRGEGGPKRLAQEMGKFLAAANKDPQLAGV
jgi:multidrug efflux pump